MVANRERKYKLKSRANYSIEITKSSKEQTMKTYDRKHENN